MKPVRNTSEEQKIKTKSTCKKSKYSAQDKMLSNSNISYQHYGIFLIIPGYIMLPLI